MPTSYLIVDTYYPSYQRSFYERTPEAVDWDYQTLLSAHLDAAFGTSDFYSKNLRSLGHSAVDVIANDERLQALWVHERGLGTSAHSAARAVLSRVPYVRRHARGTGWLHDVLGAQIEAARPDVVYFHDLNLLDASFAKRIRAHAKLLVGQIACPLPAERFVRSFDLVLTSFPHYVPRLRRLGVAAEYFRIGFEPSILPRLVRQTRPFDVVFVGGFADVHSRGTSLLEHLARQIPVDVWGYGADTLPQGSAIRRRHHGEAWAWTCMASCTIRASC